VSESEEFVNWEGVRVLAEERYRRCNREQVAALILTFRLFVRPPQVRHASGLRLSTRSEGEKEEEGERRRERGR
jgi:hypothetical protein